MFNGAINLHICTMRSTNAKPTLEGSEDLPLKYLTAYLNTNFTHQAFFFYIFIKHKFFQIFNTTFGRRNLITVLQYWYLISCMPVLLIFHLLCRPSTSCLYELKSSHKINLIILKQLIFYAKVDVLIMEGTTKFLFKEMLVKIDIWRFFHFSTLNARMVVKFRHTRAS